MPTRPTRRLLVPLTAGLCSYGLAGASALAAQHCVGHRAGCSASLQDALDAARDGDTIRLTAGTFDGGATVTKSITLAGAGQHATIIKGGGPVLTVGSLFDASPPTVSIQDLTLTGGHTTSSPQSVLRTGKEGVWALGGGLEIPPGHDFEPGATVTVRRAAITRNRVAPVATVPSGNAACPDGPCPFARAAGGGIDSWGTLTVLDSTISENRVGSASGISALASDAEAAGIFSHLGALTIVRSRIEDNRATATAPLGRFADAGGIFVFDARFIMRDSRVGGNRASLVSSWPSSVEQGAIAGGIHVAETVPAAEIANSAIAANEVGIKSAAADAVAFSGGLHVDLPVDFTISDSRISGNRVTAAARGSDAALAHADGGGGQLFGRMQRTRVVGNVVTATSLRTSLAASPIPSPMTASRLPRRPAATSRVAHYSLPRSCALLGSWRQSERPRTAAATPPGSPEQCSREACPELQAREMIAGMTSSPAERVAHARAKATKARLSSAEAHVAAAGVEQTAAALYDRLGDDERAKLHRTAAQRHGAAAVADRAALSSVDRVDLLEASAPLT